MSQPPCRNLDTVTLIEDSRRVIDDCVEAYEAARAELGDAEVGAFLPEPGHPLRQAVLRELVRVDLEYGWRRAQPRSVHDYLRDFPELAEDKTSLEEIAFEDNRLRQQAGMKLAGDRRDCLDTHEPPARGLVAESAPESGGVEEANDRRHAETLVVVGPAADPGIDEAARAYREFRLRNRGNDAPALDLWRDTFSGKREHAELFRDAHRADPTEAYRLAEAVIALPVVGAEFAGFRLLSELGQGAFGRVFLAQQGDLANRLVALKISTNLLSESQALAQLQHTNIVPIYSVHRAGPLQAVCMPYFGATTLADILKELGNRESLPASGKGLVSTLNARKSITQLASSATRGHGDSTTGRLGEGVPVSPCPPVPVFPCRPPRPGSTEILQKLEGYTYVQAVLWLASKLADGLAHAHERGILHRDLKPANILLTDEGQPMLLDFNLSADTKTQANGSAAMVGGTLPFMAPEHLDAFQEGQQPVDARSDIYGFGVILYELLTGRHPFPLHRGALGDVLPEMIADRLRPLPSLHRENQAVSPAVAAIVQRCLEPDPVRRYQTAAALREDLERQLADMPLKHTPEPSWRERGQKWMRRHPRLTSTTIGAALVAVLICGLTATVMSRQRQLQDNARDLLSQSRADLKQVEALLTVRDGDRQTLHDGLHLGREILDRYRVLDDPGWRQQPSLRYLSGGEQEQLREDLAEVLALLVQVESLPKGDPSGQPDLSGLAGLGKNAEELARLKHKAAEITIQSETRKQCLQARELIAKYRFKEAKDLLLDVVARDRQNFFGWFLLGNCADGLAENGEAVVYFNICIALLPEVHTSYFRRGLAYLRQNDFTRAAKDFSEVIRLRPALDDAYINRALAKRGLRDHSGALDDLSKALDLGSSPTRVYFLRSRLREQAGDRAGAKEDFDEGLRREPIDAESWVARGLAKLERDPHGALADFDEALEIDPGKPRWMQNKVHVLSEKLGRTEEAIAILDQSLALKPHYVPARAGRGVLLARLGKRDAALEDARKALALETTPARLYQVACIYALTSKQNPDDRLEAFRLLGLAFKQGYGHEMLEKDQDLDPLREQPEFRRLLEAARTVRQAVQAGRK